MAKNEDYWRDRFIQLEEAQDEKGAKYFAELEKQYNKAALAIQDDINKWYGRFAKNNQITLQEARKLLNSRELEELRWNVMEYIDKGKTLNISNQWAKQLENASAKFHVSRLEAIKLQIQNQVEVLYGNELDDVTKLMTDIYTDGYYHTAYEIQKGFNIGYDLMKLDGDHVAKVLAKPWAADGSNFSDRIWKHKSQLLSELHNGLTQAIIRGQDPSKVTDTIAKRFNVSKGRAGALVMTESAFFAAASNHDCYKDLGVEQYEVLATLDKRTSDICRSLDGKVFPMSQYEVGVTAPPFHVRCRTTTVPYFDDEFELDTERAARDENGKTYFVPSNMKYKEWEKAFVDGGSKKDLAPIGIDMADNSERVGQGTQIIKPINKNGEEILFDLKGKDEKFNQSKEMIIDLSNEYNTRLQTVTVGAYQAAGDVDMYGLVMRLNSNKPNTIIHEFAHTLANSKAEKIGVTHDEAFWKEIKKIKRQYHRDVDATRGNTSRWISQYEHSSDSVDEFLAEAFTQAKMNQLGMDFKSYGYGSDLTYSNKVLEAVDKYFKKEPLENIAKSGKIDTKKDLSKYIGKDIVEKDNQSVREWYYANVHDIPNQIDKSKPFEEQVKQAYELRNKYKREARVAMSDTETAERLERKRPIKPFEELVQDKMNRKNMTREEALKDVLETASKTNDDVDSDFGL